MSLAKKVVVITGGLGQLGQQFAGAFLKNGSIVISIDLTDDLSKVRDSNKAFLETGQLCLYAGNISDKKKMEQISRDIEKVHGIPTVLVNNAALDSPPNASISENGPFEDYPLESIQQSFDVNVIGTVVCCQVFGKLILENKLQGSIINIASIYGMLSPVQDIYEYKRKGGQQWYKPVSYSITKAAILNFTRYLATYWAKKNIRVNSISPSGVFNNQDQEFLSEYLKRVPIGRMANPDEIAEVVIFLAGSGSSYITGSNVVVDGGWTAW